MKKKLMDLLDILILALWLFAGATAIIQECYTNDIFEIAVYLFMAIGSFAFFVYKLKRMIYYQIARDFLYEDSKKGKK